MPWHGNTTALQYHGTIWLQHRVARLLCNTTWRFVTPSTIYRTPLRLSFAHETWKPWPYFATSQTEHVNVFYVGSVSLAWARPAWPGKASPHLCCPQGLSTRKACQEFWPYPKPQGYGWLRKLVALEEWWPAAGELQHPGQHTFKGPDGGIWPMPTMMDRHPLLVLCNAEGCGGNCSQSG